MKISDFLTDLNAVPSRTEEVNPFFGIESERWEELKDIAYAAFFTQNTMSGGFKYIDEHFSLKNEKEVLAMMYILGTEAGVRKAEGAEGTDINIHAAQLTKMYAAKSFLEKRKMRVEKQLLDYINEEVSLVSASFLGRQSRPKKKKEDDDNPMSNKNKFKKGDFDIPQ